MTSTAVRLTAGHRYGELVSLASTSAWASDQELSASTAARKPKPMKITSRRVGTGAVPHVAARFQSPPVKPCMRGEFAQDPPDPRRGQVMHGPGQRAGDPQDLAVRGRDDLQVHAVAAVLAGVERPVSGHPVDGD